ncbi:proprotein convertase P-domain-containing protein [Catelliglobosispora koreensis]|uniref:proprotein convertase P-domain-containing protein n=1 Tax=Catelliglobosispora koreensis TaxID=129052 RepID=UPI001B7FC003|nr:proprotein convertase P-domain-containing protein [Catelliglobosispora koreensis]
MKPLHILFTAVIAAATLSVPAAAAAEDDVLLEAMRRDMGLTTAQARTRLAQEARANQALQTLTRAGIQPGQTWIDAATGKLQVAVTDSTHLGAIQSAGAQAKTVKHGLAKLDAISAAISASNPPASVKAWGPDIASDRVVVITSDPAAFTLRHDAIVVHTSRNTPVQHGGDVRGGDYWKPGSEPNCSVGFSVTSSATSQRHFLTAGHCTNDANQAAYGKDGTRIGTSNVGGSKTVNALEGDFGLVDVTESAWVLSPIVTGNGVGQDIRITGSKEAIVGESVCHSGGTSKWKCGSVTKVNQTVNYGSFSVGGLTYASTCGQGGDSGGAWVNASERKAVGLHEGGYNDTCGQQESWFQPVNEALAKWNLTLVVDPPTGDTQPPTAPSNASSTGTTSSSVSLSWTASTDNVGVTGYDVYNGSALATSVAGTSATVTGLSPSTSYTFTVKARDAAGNTSAASNAVTATTQPGTPGGRTFTSTQFVFIPDPGTVDSPITSTATGSAASTVSVTVTASHWCAAELRIDLVAPNGSLYNLKPSGGTQCASYSGGTYSATGVASPASGTWKLRVTDVRSWNFGSVNSWSITL